MVAIVDTDILAPDRLPGERGRHLQSLHCDIQLHCLGRHAYQPHQVQPSPCSYIRGDSADYATMEDQLPPVSEER